MYSCRTITSRRSNTQSLTKNWCLLPSPRYPIRSGCAYPAKPAVKYYNYCYRGNPAQNAVIYHTILYNKERGRKISVKGEGYTLCTSCDWTISQPVDCNAVNCAVRLYRPIIVRRAVVRRSRIAGPLRELIDTCRRVSCPRGVLVQQCKPYLARS